MSADLDGVKQEERVDPQTVRDLVIKVNQLEADRDELQERVQAQAQQLEEQAEQIHDLQTSVREAEGTAQGALNSIRALREVVIGDRNSADFEDQQTDAYSRLEQAIEDVKDLKDTVSRHDDVIQKRGTPQSGKEEHWWKVVEKAHNLKNHPDHKVADHWVKLYKKQIAGAIEPGEKRASQLIDEWAEEKDHGVKMQPYKRITTSRQTESSDIQKKALKIDLDVWKVDDE